MRFKNVLKLGDFSPDGCAPYLLILTVTGSYNSWPTRWSYLPSSIRSPGLRPLLLVTSVG